MFTREDFALAKGLKEILNSGTFPLMAKEVSTFAKVYTWVDSLAIKIEKHLQEAKMKPIPKEEKPQPKENIPTMGFKSR